MTKGVERRGVPRKATWSLRLREEIRRRLEILLGANLVWSSAFVSVVALLLASQRCGASYPRLAVGETAPYDVRASRTSTSPTTRG